MMKPSMNIISNYSTVCLAIKRTQQLMDRKWNALSWSYPTANQKTYKNAKKEPL